MSLLLLIYNVIHPNDLNILLLVDVVLRKVALSKFPQQNSVSVSWDYII